MADTKQQTDPLKPRGRGRPKKGEIVAKKPKNRGGCSFNQQVRKRYR